MLTSRLKPAVKTGQPQMYVVRVGLRIGGTPWQRERTVADESDAAKVIIPVELCNVTGGYSEQSTEIQPVFKG